MKSADAAELDVTHLDLVLEIPQRGMNFALRERAERHRSDEMLAAFGQHGRDVMAGLLEQADQLERLVGGNSPADDQQNLGHLSCRLPLRTVRSRVSPTWPAAGTRPR